MMYSVQKGGPGKLSMGAESYLRSLQRNIRSGTTGAPSSSPKPSGYATKVPYTGPVAPKRAGTEEGQSRSQRAVSFTSTTEITSNDDDDDLSNDSELEKILLSLSESETKPSLVQNQKRNSSLIDIDVSSIATSRKPSMSFKDLKKLQQSIDMSLNSLGTSKYHHNSDSDAEDEKIVARPSKFGFGSVSAKQTIQKSQRKSSLFKKPESPDDESTINEMSSLEEEESITEVISKQASSSQSQVFEDSIESIESIESVASVSKSESVSESKSLSKNSSSFASSSSSTHPSVESSKSTSIKSSLNGPKDAMIQTSEQISLERAPAPAKSIIRGVDKDVQVRPAGKDSAAQTKALVQSQKKKARTVSTQTNSLASVNLRASAPPETRLYVDTEYLEKVIHKCVADVSRTNQPLHHLMVNVIRTHVEFTRSYAEREWKTLCEMNELLKDAAHSVDRSTFDKLKKLIDKRSHEK